MPYAATGTPPPMVLPTTTRSGSRPHARGASSGTGAQRVRLVDDEQHVVPAGHLADPVEVAVVGEHDADVRQRRLHQQAGDVALGQPTVQGAEVVERHHRGRRGHVDLRPEPTGPGHHPVPVEHGEGLVDGAVVAPVHHRHPRPPGQVPGETQHEAVGVGRRHRQLPDRQAEPTGQLLADPDGVLGRQHGGDPGRRAAGDRLRHRRQRVAGHRPRVTQAEVDVLQAVDVGEASTRRLVEEHREGSGPASHPRHRHPGQQRAAGALGQGGGARVRGHEVGLLVAVQRGQVVAVDHGGQGSGRRGRGSIPPGSSPRRAAPGPRLGSVG